MVRMVSKRAPILDRLMARREVTPTGCWLYLGALDSSGYGNVGYQGKLHKVHRLAYELLVGPIEPGLVADHRCHNEDETCSGGTTCTHRRCWNPDHLLLVSPAVNNRSGRQGKYQTERTHCPAGHAYAEHGVRYPSSHGRECRECKRLRSIAYYERTKPATGD